MFFYWRRQPSGDNGLYVDWIPATLDGAEELEEQGRTATLVAYTDERVCITCTRLSLAEHTSLGKHHMLRNSRVRIAAMALMVALPLVATPVAAAETPIPSTAEFAGIINEQMLARYFSEIDNAQTEEEAHDALVKLLGEDAAHQAIVENSAAGHSIALRGAGTFLTCIKGKASDDIKSVFDINVVAAAIGQKDYAKAAREAVKYLAKQGIKRNAVTLAGMFAYWGWQCRGSW